jgi:hypothetical protein
VKYSQWTAVLTSFVTDESFIRSFGRTSDPFISALFMGVSKEVGRREDVVKLL